MKTDSKSDPITSLLSLSSVLLLRCTCVFDSFLPSPSHSCPQTFLVAGQPGFYCWRAIGSFRNVTKLDIIKRVEYLKIALLVESTGIKSKGVRRVVAIKGTAQQGCWLWQEAEKQELSQAPKIQKRKCGPGCALEKMRLNLIVRKGGSWTRCSVKISRRTYTLTLQLAKVHDEGKFWPVTSRQRCDELEHSMIV